MDDLDPQLDKIIGSSTIRVNTFDVHYKTGACAFAAQGYVSIFVPSSKQRFDIKLTENCREITSLAFSSNGYYLAVGEAGPKARFFILSLTDRFDRVKSQTEVRTMENGFSSIAMNGFLGKLVTVGTDDQPYFLLWDLNQPKPVCFGCYHLPSIPNQVILAPDCSFAVVAGNSMLKLLQTSVQPQNKPVALRCRPANIGQYKIANYVAAAISGQAPYDVYALTNEGVLCFFSSLTNPFIMRKENGNSKPRDPLVMTPVRLNRGNVTSLALNSKLILCGTVAGTIIAIKKENDKHRVSGKYTATNKPIVAIGVSDNIISAAYDDGHLIFWNQGNNSKPFLSFSSHRGPVCSIAIDPATNHVISSGSDYSIRVWNITKNQELISKSSQEQLLIKYLSTPEKSFLNTLCGLRTLAVREGLVYTGDDDGILHILNLENLEELKSILDNLDSILCLAIHPTLPILATGGGDGNVRLYNIAGQSLSLSCNKHFFSQPVTSIVFNENVIVASSSGGIVFASLPNLDTIKLNYSSEPILTLASISKAHLVVAGGCDRHITFYSPKEGRIFRKYLMSHNNYPLVITAHKSGLILAVAMSNGIIVIVDAVSGEPVFSFDTLLGIITSVQFHENDLIIASFGGCIMRWNLPPKLHQELEYRPNIAPMFPFLGEASPQPVSQPLDYVAPIPSSFMNGQNPPPEWIYKEVKVDSIQVDNPYHAEPEIEEEEENDIEGFDKPRPSIESEGEKADDFVRASFVQSRKSVQITVPKQEQPKIEDPVPPEEIIEINLPPEKPKIRRKKQQLIEISIDDLDPPVPAQLPKPALKIDPISIEKEMTLAEKSIFDSDNEDDTDPFSITPDAPPPIVPQHPVEPTKAEQIRDSIKRLKDAIEMARKCLSQEAKTDDEIEQQQKIKDLLESLEKKKQAEEQNIRINDLAIQIKKNAEIVEQSAALMKEYVASISNIAIVTK